MAPTGVVCKYVKPHLFLSMHNPDPLCVAIYYIIFLQPTNTTLSKGRVMNNASINGYATEASLARLPFKIYIMHSMKQRKCYYDVKWFIMVKGLLAWFTRVLKSSSPSPSISSTSSTNVGNNHSKQHHKAKIKVLKNMKLTFLGYL